MKVLVGQVLQTSQTRGTQQDALGSYGASWPLLLLWVEMSMFQLYIPSLELENHSPCERKNEFYCLLADFSRP